MSRWTAIKTKSEEGLARLVEVGKKQPPQIQKWGVVGASAVAGGIAITAGAKGILAIVGLLAAPPIALTAGALGGGALGWSYMQGKAQSVESAPTAPSASVSADLAEAASAAA